MYLFAAIIAWALAQISKCVINLITNRSFSWQVALGSGGMPSSHSSAVCALATCVGLGEGFSSPLFSVAGLMAIIVMYDAMNVRRETGNQGKVLNEMIAILMEMGRDISIETKFKELVGHTPLQVAMGGLLGVVVGMAWM